MTGLKYHPLHPTIPAVFFYGGKLGGGERVRVSHGFPSWLPISRKQPSRTKMRSLGTLKAVWKIWKPDRVLKNFRKVMGRWKRENYLPDAFKCLLGRFMWQFLSEIRSLVPYMSGTGFQQIMGLVYIMLRHPGRPRWNPNIDGFYQFLPFVTS